MSNGVGYLHSHSGIERELQFQKNTVLIDERYADMFPEYMRKPFTYKRKKYFKVDILAFVNKGGKFKNLYE